MDELKQYYAHKFAGSKCGAVWEHRGNRRELVETVFKGGGVGGGWSRRDT